MHGKKRWIALLLAGTLLAAALSACSSVPSLSLTTGAIRINEVVSSNGGSLIDEHLGTPDWIELYNPSDTSVNLSGCALSDNVRDPRKYVLPDVVLGPGEHLIIYACKYDGTPPEGIYCTGFGLSKSGEMLIITDKYSKILDQVNIPSLKQDVSYARNDLGEFGYCIAPTPGSENNTRIVQSIDELAYVEGNGVLVLDEAMPNNRSGLKALDGQAYSWVEVYNPTQEAVDLSGYYLSDDVLNLKKWRMEGGRIDPLSRVVVFLSNVDGAQGELHANFKLSSEENGVYLSDSAGGVISKLEWETPITADIAVLQAEGENRYTAFPTPGEQNDARVFSATAFAPMGETDPVILNEVLDNNRYSIMDWEGDRPSWVELYNRSQDSVSLKGYYLSDREDDATKWALPEVLMQPGEYIVVFLSGKESTEEELHAPFRLSSDDDGVFLTTLNGLKRDGVTFEEKLPQNVSAGRDENGDWKYFRTPTPGAPNDTAAFSEIASVPDKNPDGVYISEVSTVSAAKSGKNDWIELYNPADRDADLSGWYLSNDRDEPQKYEITSLKVPAKGYALLYTTDRSVRQTESTATFNLSSGAGELLLSDAAGVTRDYFETGSLRVSLSSGREEDDPMGSRVYYTTATPGAKNSGSMYPGYASPPVFSETRLYHSAPFSVSLHSSTAGAVMYYTLDGTKPTAESARYTGPIEITGNTSITAMAVMDGLLNSEIVTHTYLFEAPHTVPVICLTGAQTDINSVYAARTKPERVEREVYAEYFEAGGSLGIAFPCGLRASGASTLTAAQKSFTIFLRGGYGRGTITYPFFEEYHIDTFSSLTIRSSGQDRARARLRDSYVSSAAEGLYIDNVATRPVVVYINGKYWGIYDLNENQNEDFLASYYGADPDRVDIIRRNISTLAGRNTDIKRIQAYGRSSNFSNDSVYEKYCEWVDMDYVIDYLIVQTFFQNSDIFNQKYWRSQDYSVKWRPVLFDLDYAMTGHTRNLLPSYFSYAGVPSQDLSITNMDMFCGLPKSKIFAERFVKRYVYVVENYLNAERLTALLDEMAGALRPEMERHIKRWGAPSSLSKWEDEVKELRGHLEQRPTYALRHVQNYFGVSDATMQEYKQLAKNN
ncbi:lamin tail domain-containing protein [Christensenellaceae bacterium OttesenSCG-928-M15]|nr:lamin tail domain-containing protein [Christensenellaceae bacterium OttesenSCG-928-M15]